MGQPVDRHTQSDRKGGCMTSVTYYAPVVHIKCLTLRVVRTFLSFPFLGCRATRWRLNRLYLIQNNETAGHMAGPGVFQLHSHGISNGKVYRMLHSKHDVLI